VLVYQDKRILREKIEKICSNFCDESFPLPEQGTQASFKQELSQTAKEIGANFTTLALS